MEPITVLLICTAALYFSAELLLLIGIPRVVSQILAGIAFGIPAIKSIIFTPESYSIIEFLAYIGAILLLFFVGLQMNLKKFEKNVGVSLWISFFNTSMPLVFGFLASKYIFGFSNGVSFVIGICMSVSATAFALDLLEEFGKLRTKLGTTIVTAGAIDDIVEMALVTVALAFIGEKISGLSIIGILTTIFMFLAMLIAFRMILIPFVLKVVEKRGYRPALFTGALIITLVFAVTAEYIGVGALIGALFGGMLIKQVLLHDAGHRPWETAEISKAMHTMAFGFLVPFFFFSVGLNTDVISIWHNLGFGITITAITIVGTVFGTALGYWLIFKNWRDAWLAGWSLNAKGDTELVIGQLALTAGIITSAVFSSLIFMAVITTLISPLVVEHLIKKNMNKIK